MVRLIIISLFVVLSFGGEILNISYFPSNNKVDVLLSLDKPFKGKVTKLGKNDYQISKINLNRIEQKKIKNDLNIMLSTLDNDSVELKIISEDSLSLKPSITAKGYGLRLRILGIKDTVKKPTFLAHNQPPTATSFNVTNYVIVIVVLILLIIILLFVRKKVSYALPSDLKKDNYKLLYQKMIDPKNKIVLIEIFDKRYLLLLGDKNNILLDDFSKQNQEELKEISSQDKFNHLLEDKLNEDDFMKKASQLKEMDEL